MDFNYRPVEMDPEANPDIQAPNVPAQVEEMANPRNGAAINLDLLDGNAIVELIEEIRRQRLIQLRDMFIANFQYIEVNGAQLRVNPAQWGLDFMERIVEQNRRGFVNEMRHRG